MFWATTLHHVFMSWSEQNPAQGCLKRSHGLAAMADTGYMTPNSASPCGPHILQAALQLRGTHGIISIGRKFRSMDDNGDKKMGKHSATGKRWQDMVLQAAAGSGMGRRRC